MRTFILMAAMSLLAVLVGCNSQEGTSRGPDRFLQKGASPQAAQTVPHQNPSDSARRITAEELHKLWEKDDVLIVDTRNEPSFKQGHIRGAILIPTAEFASRADELPKSKMIVTYCT